MIVQVIEFHRLFSNTIWLFFLALGVWGLWRAARGQGIDGSYLGAAVIGQVLYMIQGILGGYLWANGLLVGLARPSMHVLYGVFAVVFLPFVYLVWLRGDDSNRGQWVMAFATLFLFGIGLRAIYTGT
jgi:heme A synthase